MTIEPSDNPHIVIGKLTHENTALKSTLKILREEHENLNKALVAGHKDYEALRQQLQQLDDNLQLTRGQLLGCREANKVLEDKNKELEKLLDRERHAYARLKCLRHGGQLWYRRRAVS